MIHTLETITLADFIKIVMGDISFAGDEHETEETKLIATGAMANEYSKIVGGKTLASTLARKNSELNNLMKVELMDKCDLLANLGMWQELSDILKDLGYAIPPGNKEDIESRIKAIRSSCLMKLEIAPKDEEKEVDKDFFVKERVMLDSHYKMHIDPSTWKAKEYAYLVKSFCDEMRKR